MHPIDTDILSTLANRIRDRFPEAQIWAFGSRARGDASWESDLDVCIVIGQSPTRAIKDWIGDIAWEVGFDADRVITTVIYSQEAFEEGPQSASALVANIHNEGVAA